jgi:hypothetical protein
MKKILITGVGDDNCKHCWDNDIDGDITSYCGIRQDLCMGDDCPFGETFDIIIDKIETALETSCCLGNINEKTLPCGAEKKKAEVDSYYEIMEVESDL